MPAVTLAGLFEELRVPRRGVLYLHSSMDWMWRVGLGLDEVLVTLTSWAGDRGTLVVPTFPFVRGHEEYLRTRPHLDVRTTPTQAGVLNEFSFHDMRSMEMDGSPRSKRGERGSDIVRAVVEMR